MFIGGRKRLIFSGIIGRSSTENEGRSDGIEDGKRLMEVPTSYCRKWRRKYSGKTDYHTAWRVKDCLKSINIKKYKSTYL